MDDQRQLAEHEHEVGSGIFHVFGQHLKLFRLQAGLERAEFGAMTGYSASSIASFEQGRRIPPPGFIDQEDELLDAGGVLKASKEEVARAQYPAFFRDAARLEAEAVELHLYANHGVPGLLQTAEYARAVFEMWQSSYSSGAGGECVEVATRANTVHVRDSKDKMGPILSVTSAGWAALVEFAAQG